MLQFSAGVLIPFMIVFVLGVETVAAGTETRKRKAFDKDEDGQYWYIVEYSQKLATVCISTLLVRSPVSQALVTILVQIIIILSVAKLTPYANAKLWNKLGFSSWNEWSPDDILQVVQAGGVIGINFCGILSATGVLDSETAGYLAFFMFTLIGPLASYKGVEVLFKKIGQKIHPDISPPTSTGAEGANAGPRLPSIRPRLPSMGLGLFKKRAKVITVQKDVSGPSVTGVMPV